MSIVFTIIIIVASLVALFFLIALVVKREYSVDRQIVINKPVAEVFSYVKYLKNQDHYSKWVMMDPNLRKEFRGLDGTVGFVYAWEGNKQAGKGEQEIVSIVEQARVDTQVRFVKPFKAVAKAHIVTNEMQPTQTKVTWGMSGESKYPMNFSNLFMPNLLGKDIDESLVRLKGILEKG